jgi:hypothetical protein
LEVRYELSHITSLLVYDSEILELACNVSLPIIWGEGSSHVQQWEDVKGFLMLSSKMNLEISPTNFDYTRNEVWIKLKTITKLKYCHEASHTSRQQ